MKILCMVKFIPDVDNFIYDYERNVLVREQVNLILNPDDAAALALALQLKAQKPEVSIEVLTMAPLGIIEQVRDLLRRNVDQATIISDRLYAGSDTYITSKILGRYIKRGQYDYLISGTHSLDGDTQHVPSQLAELLGLNHMAHITKVDIASINEKMATFEVDYEQQIATFQMKAPMLLSISKDSGYKLPFVRYADLELDVEERITIVTNEELQFTEAEVGLKGSPTKVVETYTKKLETRKSQVVSNNEEGIEVVYQFLKTKGFLAYEEGK